ncbi:hypothetical protein SAMD00019534_042230 [Acytostelium subglobosum LB1]|uniref:hypothetical protein n=1 Tax=Acytostelium subglobosum LB1 TaxID=1410327 RepID=UPI000644DE6C|nr:hypothetical protein SAMD00019534_042230 [Acytostelium subglobosum LB1]GAM21048.1 hypothetical protein SAMD00019534_042230 [Acytostelium subglobosum LB1]|eukprot:XP_012756182.1 hypothetical protein SAMD00019534_042230 [Acytostelium subglobosum LB1]
MDVVIQDWDTYSAQGIVVFTLNRPQHRNALNRVAAEKLSTCFRQFDNDDRYKVAILYGGTNVFCSGADLKAVASGDEKQMNRLEPDGDSPMGVARMMLSKPVIAAICGYCVAGGLELALWCDLRVADEETVFGVFCRRWGVPLIDGGSVRLPRLIGQSRAMDLILTGRPVSAKEAYEILAPLGKALDVAVELATLISSFPQECMRSDRKSMYEQHGLSLNDALKNEFGLGVGSLRREGVSGAKRFESGSGRHGQAATLTAKL